MYFDIWFLYNGLLRTKEFCIKNVENSKVMGDDVKHLTAGSIAGAAGKFFAFPMDTVKVRLQHRPDHYKGYGDCFKQMIQKEGIMGFYRGLGAPLAGASLENAVLFWGYAFTQKLSCKYFDAEPGKPSLSGIAVSGCMAGLAVAQVNTPVEMLKCKMQVENMKPKQDRLYSGVVDVATQMIRKGGVMSLYQGNTATMLREGPGNAGWFLTYNLILRGLTPAGKTKSDLPTYNILFAGGMSGVMYWCAFFPADTVKTKMQLDPAYKNMGFLTALQRAYASHGMKGLYAGWLITVCRAFPANGVTFAVYEHVVRLWDRRASRAAAGAR